MYSQLKFEECMTFKEKMEARGWHNCYDAEPDKPGIYQIYRRNGGKGKAYYSISFLLHLTYPFLYLRYRFF